MQWVHATPKTKDGQLTSVKIGFRGSDLAQLEILDSFGQRSVITFTKMELNGNVPAAKFQFMPPKGADVVKQ
jgi:outer membrane lipoprotein carrier protein